MPFAFVLIAKVSTDSSEKCQILLTYMCEIPSVYCLHAEHQNQFKTVLKIKLHDTAAGNTCARMDGHRHTCTHTSNDLMRLL